MARKPNKNQPPPKNSASDAVDTTILERVQELTWAMLDEELSDDEFGLLENLLLCDDKARGTYVDCIQLHTDLMAHYAAPTTKLASVGGETTPVMGFLNMGAGRLNAHPSPAQDATS